MKTKTKLAYTISDIKKVATLLSEDPSGAAAKNYCDNVPGLSKEERNELFYVGDEAAFRAGGDSIKYRFILGRFNTPSYWKSFYYKLMGQRQRLEAQEPTQGYRIPALRFRD